MMYHLVALPYNGVILTARGYNVIHYLIICDDWQTGDKLTYTLYKYCVADTYSIHFP